MLEAIVTVCYIVGCILLFSLAIAIHEFGHFIAAVKLGLRVDKFSIGFGPAIWKKKINGVEYRISAIPFGGYVSIPDLDPEGTKALQGSSVEQKEKIPAWKEVIVAFAGPFMNIVLAVVLAVALSLMPSANFGVLGTEIGYVVKGGPAQKAGLMKGDKVLSVNGNKVSSWNEMLVEVQIAGNQEAAFEVARCTGDQCSVETVFITPEKDEVSGAYFIKALSVTNDSARAASWMTHRHPLKQLKQDAVSIFRVLKGLVTPKEMKSTGSALGGPVMIAQGIYKSIRHDFADGIGFLRFLNVNLAVINLLPLPVLDGGLILFALISLIFRRRIPEKVVRVLSMMFMVLLLGLMCLLVWRDSVRSFKMHSFKKDAAIQEEILKGK
jgi:regulator of sigma E protease